MIPIQRDIALDTKTTLHIGGAASYYCMAQNADDIEELVTWAKDNDKPVLMLGNGSNMLVSDEGWPGLVIEFGDGLKRISWQSNCVRCGSAASMSALVAQSVDRNLAGNQFLAGIPGTIGGALVMNAGAFGQEISDCLDWANVFDLKDNTRVRMSRPDIKFGYRTSSLKKSHLLIIEAQFCLNTEAPDTLREEYAETLKKRKDRQPLDKPNCGSVFKRPPGNYSGALIEQCGLKGMRVGDAMVSEKHANFIVNMGKASAEDMRALIAAIQQRVYEKNGVLLEPEVVFAGEFKTALFKPE